MTIKDAFADRKKNEVMEDTWGHLYPEPGSKHSGTILLAVGQYGDETIIKSEFPLLESSPQKYEIEHTIFDWMTNKQQISWEGIYKVNCTLWFFKNSNNITGTTPIGKIIKIKIQKVEI